MDLMDILRQAGFTGSSLDTAYAIAMAESGGNAKAFNGNQKTGDRSYGLFQINMLGGMGPERRKQFGLSSNDSLYDALTNARVAFKMSDGGKNWSPWSTYNNDTYRRFLGQTGGTVTGATPQAATPSAADLTGSPSGSFAPDLKGFSPQSQGFTPQASRSSTRAPAASSSSLRDKAIAAAMSMLGTPYAWGGGGPGGPSAGFGRGAGVVGFDCSSLMQFAYAAAGYSIARTSQPQLASGVRVPLSQLQPGDFLGWGDGGHIAMYLGNGQYIQAPSTGGHVEVKTLGKGSSAWGVHLTLPGD